MKKMIKYCLITAAILFGTKITFGMEGKTIPKVELAITNTTKDNFELMTIDNKNMLGRIKAGSKITIAIPISQNYEQILKLVNTGTPEKEYIMRFTITPYLTKDKDKWLVFPHFSLEKITTQPDKPSLKKITEISDKIDAGALKSHEYKIYLTLKGDDLAKSGLGYGVYFIQ